MKSYEEVTRDLLKRRNEYEETHTKRQRNALRIAVPVCSVALVAAMGVGVWKGGVLVKQPIAGESGNSGVSAAGQFVSPDDPHTSDKIVINKVETVGSTAQDIGLNDEDFVEMTYEEKMEYYGAEIEPDVPEDLTDRVEPVQYGIYRENGGTGEVYYDNTGFGYYDEDDSIMRFVRIAASKGGLPFSCVVWADECKDKSYIQGVEIMIVNTNDGYYCAELMVRGVGFRIEASGLSDEEFVSVVASIIEKNK